MYRIAILIGSCLLAISTLAHAGDVRVPPVRGRDIGQSMCTQHPFAHALTPGDAEIEVHGRHREGMRGLLRQISGRRSGPVVQAGRLSTQ